ncbi:MAG: helix-turn-helix transcriptional regulator [Bacillota bacterium]|nr:helix-turn-helix transcriptional regulator [Bacillota bacterium]
MQAQLKVNLKNFTELMNKYSLSMADLAKKLGVSRAQLWRVLNDKSNPGEQFIAGFKASFPKENFDNFFSICVLQQNDTTTTA